MKKQATTVTKQTSMKKEQKDKSPAPTHQKKPIQNESNA